MHCAGWSSRYNVADCRVQGLVVLRAFPFIADLPVKAIQAQGEVKTIVRDIARKIIERNATESKDNSLLSSLCERPRASVYRMILTLHCSLARQVAKGEVDSSNEELLDHVSAPEQHTTAKSYIDSSSRLAL